MYIGAWSSEYPPEDLYQDLHGDPVERNPISYPYTYDAFIVYRSPDFNKNECNVAYSDRMMQWNFEKFRRCCEIVFGNSGQTFYNREPKDISRFLGLYFGKRVKLTAVMQGCNISNGCPYWIFFYEVIN